MSLPRKTVSALAFLIAAAACPASDNPPPDNLPPLHAVNFSQHRLSPLPDGWRDLTEYRPTRNWLVDASGFARVILKEFVGDPTEGDRLARRRYLESHGMRHFTAVAILDRELPETAAASARFKKTPDAEVTFGVVLGATDRDNYHAARLAGRSAFELVRVRGNKAVVLASIPTTRRIRAGDVWNLRFRSDAGGRLAARLFDENGVLLAQLHALDASFRPGAAGLAVTTFAAAADFEVRAAGAGQPAAADTPAGGRFACPLVRAIPSRETARLNTPFNALAADYDVVVAGGGTGGFGAAMQAARMGARVLWIEETDLIGGQMANAGVTSMDDGGISGKNPVRERGLYREFHESAAQHYYNLDKDPFTAYHFNRQSEGGFEPRVARGILYGLLAETRARQAAGKPVTLHLAVRTRVTAVHKNGGAVTGAALEEWREPGAEDATPRRRDVTCRVLVDATEYGDLLPLAGARYRVGASTSDAVEPDSPMQEHTWLAVVREYPEGVPAALRLKTPPKLADEMARRFRKYTLEGANVWGAWAGSSGGKKAAKAYKGDRYWRGYIDWRGMPDSDGPATGVPSELRHTRGGLNGGNDYPVTAATAENHARRLRDEANGIERTLGILWFFQNTLGVNWAPDDAEACATPYNLAKMRERGIRDDLLPLAAMLPQIPYVREARRLAGVQTLVGRDFYVRAKDGKAARHWASSVAINDYSFDLHGTEDALEPDLDEPDPVNGTGPVCVPFGVFIPEKVDGLVPAEKNISQSRLVNGATRLQPSTLLNGQAAGAIAALSALQKTPPRRLNIIAVQTALLASGDTLVPRWFGDVPHGSPLWRATQLLALYGIMDVETANVLKTEPLGETTRWGADRKPDAAENAATLARLAAIIPDKSLLPSAGGLARFPDRAALALHLATLVARHGRYHLGDPEPWQSAAHQRDLAAALAKRDASRSKGK